MGNAGDEYEDATAVDEDECRFAIADGATESSYSKEWAHSLVGAFTGRRLDPFFLRSDLLPLQREWQKEVDGRDLPWYAEQKASDGAAATFICLTMDWHHRKGLAVAVGDCCLFIVRRGRLVFSFPLVSSKEFGNRPALMSSIPERNSLLESSAKVSVIECKERDVVLLMSDALAHYFLSESEQGCVPKWIASDRLNEESFGNAVTKLRQVGKLRNDDVSVIALAI